MRLRTKFLFLFLAAGAFPLVTEGLAAAWSLRIVGRDVDHLHIYRQADDICGQIQAELAQLPDLEALKGRPGPQRRQLIRHADRSLVLCRSLERLTVSASSLAAIARVRSAVWTYRTKGRVYALALEEEAKKK